MPKWANNALIEAIEILSQSNRLSLASDLSRIAETTNFLSKDIFRDSRIETLSLTLLQVGCFSELRRALLEFVRMLNVDHCSLYVVKEIPQRFFRTKMVTTYPKNWIDAYIGFNYSSIDKNFVSHKDPYNKGFYWNFENDDCIFLENFFRDAEKFGIGLSGYTEITKTKHGDEFGFSVSSKETPNEFFDRFEFYLPDMALISEYFAHAFLSASSDSNISSINPSSEGIKILRAIGEGVSLEDLKRADYRFGSFSTLSKSICSMFGSQNIYQAAVQAARMGLLNDVVLTMDSVVFADVENMKESESV